MAKKEINYIGLSQELKDYLDAAHKRMELIISDCHRTLGKFTQSQELRTLVLKKQKNAREAMDYIERAKYNGKTLFEKEQEAQGKLF
jgi:hypothetical protein